MGETFFIETAEYPEIPAVGNLTINNFTIDGNSVFEQSSIFDIKYLYNCSINQFTIKNSVLNATNVFLLDYISYIVID